MTYESHITELGKTRDESRENKAWSAAVNAEVARGKAAGFYNNQHIHLHKNVTQSREENDAELVEALKNYKPIINGQAVDLSQVIDVEVTDEPSPSSKSLPKEKHSDQKKNLFVLIMRTKSPKMLFIFFVYISLSNHGTRHEPIELLDCSVGCIAGDVEPLYGVEVISLLINYGTLIF